MDRLGELPGLVEVGRRRLASRRGRRTARRPGRGRSPPRCRRERGRTPPAVRSPVRNARSRSSTSLVSSVAASASVRATSTVGTPATSAASRAALSVRTNCDVGTSTLPPRWPHFFSDASWSSKCTPAAPASIIPVISSNAFSGPPKPASASATIGTSQSRSLPALRPVDPVGAQQRVVDAPHHRRARCSPGTGSGPGTRCRRGCRRPRPASRRGRSPSDRPSPSAPPARRSARRARARTVLVVEQPPEPLGAAARERVLDGAPSRAAARRRPRRSRARSPLHRSPCSHDAARTAASPWAGPLAVAVRPSHPPSPFGSEMFDFGS